MPILDHAAIQEQSPDLAELRAQVRSIERGNAGRLCSVMSLGMPTLDGCLAGGGLALGRVHEVIGEARSEVRDAAAFGFVIALLVRLLKTKTSGGEVLWCLRNANPYGGMLSARGLEELGLDPDRIIIVEARVKEDRLWAMEEALGCSGLVAVVTELGPAHLGAGSKDTVSCRRLQLAAEASGVTGVLLRPNAGVLGSTVGATESRWRVTSNLCWGREVEIGCDWWPRWRVELLRARNGYPGDTSLIWEAERGIFHESGPLSGKYSSLELSSRAVTPAERSAA